MSVCQSSANYLFQNHLGRRCGLSKCRFLGPTPDLLNQTLHFKQAPMEGLFFTEVWEPLFSDQETHTIFGTEMRILEILISDTNAY